MKNVLEIVFIEKWFTLEKVTTESIKTDIERFLEGMERLKYYRNIFSAKDGWETKAY